MTNRDVLALALRIAGVALLFSFVGAIAGLAGATAMIRMGGWRLVIRALGYLTVVGSVSCLLLVFAEPLAARLQRRVRELPALIPGRGWEEAVFATGARLVGLWALVATVRPAVRVLFPIRPEAEGLVPWPEVAELVVMALVGACLLFAPGALAAAVCRKQRD